MKSADFAMIGRPKLGAIKHFPVVEFADYERRLSAMQETLQFVQQAYLGTSNRAVIVLEGWDTAGKGGVVRRLGWALDPRSFKVHAIAAPNGREKSLHYLQPIRQGITIISDAYGLVPHTSHKPPPNRDAARPEFFGLSRVGAAG